MSSKTCRLCGNVTLSKHLGLRNGSTVLRCRTCTNASTDPEPSVDYRQAEFAKAADKVEALWRSYSRNIVDFILNDLHEPGRLLEVGCSHGLLLSEAMKRGFEAVGVEPSLADVDYCRAHGLDVRPGYLAEGTFPEQSFDAIALSHVLEHVLDPVAFLALCRRLLRPGGVIFLAQPNYQGTLARLNGKRWYAWAPEQHYYHFSPEGLAHVLREAGLSVAALKLLPLSYRLEFEVTHPRRIPGVLLNTFNYFVSRYRLGFPYRGDQIYALARAASS